MNAYGEIDVQIHVFLTSGLMKVNSQFHALAALTPESHKQETGRAPESIWALQKYLACARHRTSVRRLFSLQSSHYADRAMDEKQISYRSLLDLAERNQRFGGKLHLHLQRKTENEVIPLKR